MLGSVTLDITIGLIFVYLLYSLLATIIAEIISTALGLRARNLAIAIKRMLTDQKSDNFYGDILNLMKPVGAKLLSCIYWLVPLSSLKNYKGSFKNLADEFYEMPSVKYLSQNKLFNRPSYIKSSTFSRTLVEMLKNKGEEDVLDDLGAIYSALGKNLDGNNETSNHLTSLMVLANNDIEKFKAYLEEWYDETMQRAAGWYKRWIQIILLIIGFGIAVCFNVNTFEIVEKLAKDKDAREQLVALAANAEKYKPFIENIRSGRGVLGNDTLSADSISLTLNDVKKQMDTLNRAREMVMKDINEANKLIGFSRPNDLEFWPPKKELISFKIDSVELGLKKGEVKMSEEDSAQNHDILLHYCAVRGEYAICHKQKAAAIKLSPGTKLEDGCRPAFIRSKYAYGVLVGSFTNLIGFLITALAISLGAPFWFDLLNKLMKLRTSTVQTASKESGREASASDAVPITKREG